jgi:hypothetical protein
MKEFEHALKLLKNEEGWEFSNETEGIEIYT